jgi:hypothetical protein
MVEASASILEKVLVIGQSKLSPQSSDIAADTLRSRVLYRLLFQGHHKAVSVISPSVPDNAGHLYDWVISDGSKRIE